MKFDIGDRVRIKGTFSNTGTIKRTKRPLHTFKLWKLYLVEMDTTSVGSKFRWCTKLDLEPWT